MSSHDGSSVTLAEDAPKPPAPTRKDSLKNDLLNDTKGLSTAPVQPLSVTDPVEGKSDVAVEEAIDTERQNTLPPKGYVAVPLSKFGFVLVFIALALAIFLAALDQTIVGVALPRIGEDFGDFAQVPWIGTAYLLTATPIAPLYGKMADIFGRKACFMFAIAVFEIGSAICGAAPNMVALIIGRAIAGIGGGGLFSLVLIIISDIVSFEDRGKFQGIIGAVFGLASVAGPLLGGAFTDSHLTWRWCFYINLPIGIFTIVVVFFALRFPQPTGSISQKLARVDYLGTIVLIAAVIALLLPLQLGGSDWAWNSPQVVVLFIVAILLLLLFAWIEMKVAVEPVIPPALFENRSVPLICAIAFCLGAGFFSVVYYITFYFQIVYGDSPMKAGLESLPLMFGVVIFSIICGQIISRTGYYTPLFFTGGALLTTGVALISTLSESSNRGMQIGYLLIAGVGVGNLIQTRVIGAQASVSPKNIATVTSTVNFFQTFGGVIGIAIVGTIFNNAAADNLREALAQLPAGSPPLPFDPATAPSAVTSLPEPVRSLVIHAFTQALSLAYKCALPFTALILVLAVGVKQYRRQGGPPAAVVAE
ncbi:hypothetical protein HK097_005099 [Rhizophlyctis rosea]|uniref:Major facilitator superfamily (MFS) profile domain-containing protein n=1 Tax=Rhizophlyctis rosea TaxID=64517 RepID=A0AAD5SJA1_9FUNG|nr:hypothetical protein HK097_005099 [Rhizophlyctis rosea]